MLTKKHIDATNGPLVPNILAYMLPVLINSLIQQIYNSVDKIVLGNMASSAALAAVGASSYTYAFLINLFVGCATGVRVVLARYIGKRDENKIRSTVDTSLILSVAFGAVAAVIGYFIIPWLMTATKCPADCYQDSVLYLRIYISGAPIVLLSNFSTAIMNTAGDTRRTMIIGLLSGFAKVCLNLLLCLILPNKIVAVSLGTILSVLLTVTMNLYFLSRGVGLVKIQLRKISWNAHICGKVLSQGLPVGLASCLSPLADMMLQTQTNLLGVAAMAGGSAASTLDHISLALIGALPVTCGVFVGQNLGAQKHDRVKKTLFWCLGLQLAFGIFSTVVSFLVREPVMRAVLPNDPEGMAHAMIKLNRILPVITFFGLGSLLEQYVRSLGYTSSSSAVSLFVYLGLRLMFVWFIYPKYGTYDVLMYHYAVAYVGIFLGQSILAVIAYYRHGKGKYKRL